MQLEQAIDKLDQNGRQLYDMLAQSHDVSWLTALQIERILSFQKRITSVDDNPLTHQELNISPKRKPDMYPKRFKLDTKGKRRGYLDTAKFWKVLSSNPSSVKISKTQEELIAQA